MSKTINKIAMMSNLIKNKEEVIACLSDNDVEKRVIDKINEIMMNGIDKTRVGLRMPKEKKPLNKYQIFCENTRPSLKEKYPNAKFPELSKLLSKAWKDYKSSSEIDEEDVPVKEKKPLTKYQIFCAKIRPSLKEKYPDAKFSELSTLLSKAWKDYKSGKEEEVEEKVEEEVAVPGELDEKEDVEGPEAPVCEALEEEKVEIEEEKVEVEKKKSKKSKKEDGEKKKSKKNKKVVEDNE